MHSEKLNKMYIVASSLIYEEIIFFSSSKESDFVKSCMISDFAHFNSA